MFASAIAKAREFTRPVFISIYTGEKKLASSLGAFVIVNSDGWVLTAHHMAQQYETLNAKKKAYADHIVLRDQIKNDPGLLGDQKRKKLNKLGEYPADSVIDFAFWWGDDKSTFVEAHAVPEADLALCKLDNFDGKAVKAYPLFKDPAQSIDPGTSMCKLGFPFTQIKHNYDGKQFSVDTTGIVFFPNDGILTRTITNPANPAEALYIETSSPGLKGQSGGPIFDRNATVWGIQSHTGHLALGFSPKAPTGEVEHQFLNVGRGSHPTVIANLMKKIGVKFDVL